MVITRATHQVTSMRDRLHSLGARTLEAPSIQLGRPPLRDSSYYQEDHRLIHHEEAVRHCQSYDWIIFTSRNAVLFAEEHWQAHGGIHAMLAQVGQPEQSGAHRAPTLACIGRSTYHALQSILTAQSQEQARDVKIPQVFTAEGLLDLLSTYDMKQQKVLIPRALVAREHLPSTLSKWGAQVWISPMYQTLMKPLQAEVRGELLRALSPEITRYLTFTSDSTLTHFIEQFSPEERSKLLNRARVAVIGPIVERAACRLGIDVHCVAQPHTIDGLIDTLISDYRRHLRSL